MDNQALSCLLHGGALMDDYICRLPRLFLWGVIWLPFEPLSGAGLSLYVDHLLTDSSEEMRKLRGYMYAYRAS